MYTHCKKCLTSRTGDILGEPCKTSGCDGVIEEVPAFNTLVDELPEPMTCSRRAENASSVFKLNDGTPGKDRWQKFKSNGDRVCSYCGSLHPEDMFRLVTESANASTDAPWMSVVEIEQSDKNYKVYVHQPGVRNASEGGIKFYMQHLPRGEDGKIAVTDAQQAEYSRAVSNSKIRFSRYLAGKRKVG